MSIPISPDTEPLIDELGRLVREYHEGGACAEEAWNMITDCVVERWEELSGALRRAEAFNV